MAKFFSDTWNPNQEKTMETEELRIGNYIYGENKTVAKIIEIRLIDGRYNAHARYTEPIIATPEEELLTVQIPIVDFEPIPLTEEWFLKFGYVKSGLRWTAVGNFDLFQLRDEVTYKVSDGVELIVKHVHQLQNLYYALTGLELNNRNSSFK